MQSKDELKCSSGHTYPVVRGVPVLLVEETRPTHWACTDSFRQVAVDSETESTQGGSGIHPHVAKDVVGTCGFLYRPLKGQLPRYPIPSLRLPDGEGRSFLELGSNWGRWSISAAQRGYRPVALDPWLDAALAGVSVAEQLGVQVEFVVGDARTLPFKNEAFDTIFSYSVLQHFGKDDVARTLDEVARVARPGASVLIQMANRYGIRQLLNRARQLIKGDRNPFRVRYWTPREMLAAFDRQVGESALEVDGYFSLNVQPADLDIMTRRHAAIIRLSEGLRRLSRDFPVLGRLADSIYVRSRVRRAQGSE